MLAERGGFEPPRSCPLRAFQARALGHYATSPAFFSARMNYFLFFARIVLNSAAYLEGFFKRVLAARVDILILTVLPVRGSVTLFFDILGRKRRRVLSSEWLILLPV